MKIAEKPKNYTVLKYMIFFEEGERTSLSELENYFCIESIALLIKGNYIVRDSTSIRPHE